MLRAPRGGGPFSTSSTVVPIAAGDSVTVMPALRMASILSAAPPLPPEMMAPAWPMRRPGGAVRPAMKPTMGLASFSARTKSAAFSSALPPISPIITIASVSSSRAKRARQSMKSVPAIGSPPMPIQVDCPSPAAVVCPTASYVRVPERETMPTRPRRWMWPGMMPILHSSGVMMPGQLGPMRRVREPASARLTRTMSSTGMPSVMQTTRPISASMASRIASAAKGAGT